MRSADMAMLLAEARHRRERFELYKARLYGLRPTSLRRLRELELAWRGAESRLRRAQTDSEADSSKLPESDTGAARRPVPPPEPDTSP
jgi:hypothetical protein